MVFNNYYHNNNSILIIAETINVFSELSSCLSWTFIMNFIVERA